MTAYQGGRHDEAAQALEVVLADDPTDVDALHLLGVTRLAQGDAQACVELLERALAVAPRDEEILTNQGLALRDVGRLDDAEASMRLAVEIAPGNGHAQNNLGTLLDLRGDREGALESFTRAVEAQPEYGVAHYNLGRVQRLTGRVGDAIVSLRKATELDEGLFVAWLELGRACAADGRRQAATDSLRRALMLRPSDPEVLEAMGDNAHLAGAHGDAAHHYRRSLQSDPGRASAWYSLGCVELARDGFAYARTAFAHCLELTPDDAEARYQFGKACFELGLVEDAIDALRQVMDTTADDVGLHTMALDAVAKFLPGDARASADAVLGFRREWAAARCPPSAPPAPFPPRDDVLRVGYVSAFFGHRNWMKPVWALVNAHDRTRVAVHLFSDGPRGKIGDEYVPHERDGFHDVTGLTNDELAALVRSERIDVLVDLNGFSRAERLGVFPLRPAPVGVEWFNCFGPSGVTGIDHVVGDAHVLPEGSESSYLGRVWRVSGSTIAFEVRYPVPDVTPPPCLDAGHVTFGSLVSGYKLTPAVLDAWARILRGAPTSRLLLRNQALASEGNRTFLAARFEALGIATGRLTLEGPAEHDAFLRTYDRIDVALDTFPYNGGTTTTEAIWQGVPVLTFEGDRWAARMSASLLRAGGLDDFVAPDLETHVADAVRLANDPATPQALAELRASMRERLRAAPVCDCAALARDMEEIYDRLRQ